MQLVAPVATNVPSIEFASKNQVRFSMFSVNLCYRRAILVFISDAPGLFFIHGSNPKIECYLHYIILSGV